MKVTILHMEIRTTLDANLKAAKTADIQQYANLGIKEAFEREGIEFAYPTSNIYIKNQSTNIVNTPKQTDFLSN